MKISRNVPILLIFFLFISIAFSGCIKNNSFISSNKLRDKLVGDPWKLQKLLNWDIDETWIFEGSGRLSRTLPNGTIIDEGVFEVAARPLNSKISISGMKNENYNGKWFIVNLKGNVLQINLKYKDCEGGAKACGTFERELYR